jgi:hypothetical protein
MKDEALDQFARIDGEVYHRIHAAVASNGVLPRFLDEATADELREVFIMYIREHLWRDRRMRYAIKKVLRETVGGTGACNEVKVVQRLALRIKQLEEELKSHGLKVPTAVPWRVRAPARAQEAAQVTDDLHAAANELRDLSHDLSAADDDGLDVGAE